jgi:hypothetical protein
MNAKTWIVAAACFTAAGLAQAACYTVYKADGSVLQEGSISPVNLSLPIGDTVPEKFGPGASMTVSEHGFFCRDRREEVQSAQKSLAEQVRAEGEKPAEMAIKQPAAAPEVASNAAR